jgi:hypothetical protein
MRALMDLLDRWRSDIGFALVVTMHLRKRQAGIPPVMDDIYGHSSLVRGAEVVLGLQMVAQGVSRLFFWKDRSGVMAGADPWMLRYEEAEGYTALKREKIGASDTERAVIQVLAPIYPDGLTRPQIEERTRLPTSSVKSVLQRLERGGFYDLEKRPRTQGGQGFVYALRSIDSDEWEDMAHGDGAGAS